jgi:hypothetical protein
MNNVILIILVSATIINSHSLSCNWGFAESLEQTHPAIFMKTEYDKDFMRYFQNCNMRSINKNQSYMKHTKMEALIFNYNFVSTITHFNLRVTKLIEMLVILVFNTHIYLLYQTLVLHYVSFF